MSIWGNPIMMGGSGGGGGGGATVLSGILDPATTQGKNGDMYFQLLGTVPSGYEQVEYIQSGTSGEAYIDTLFTFNQDSSIEIDFMPLNLSGDKAIYGSRESGSSRNTELHFYNTASAYIGYGSNTAVSAFGTISDNTRYLLRQEKNLVYKNGSLIYTFPNRTFTTPFNMVLFAIRNNSSTPSWHTSMRLYYCKIWDNGTLVRLFIPCKRLSDDVAGLYDIVNDEFYTTPQSAFTLGPSFDENTIQQTFAKVNGAWQDLIGTDINDIDLGSGVPLMTRAEWDVLSASEKRQYGFVGVEDYNTGYRRGILYYGADYDLKSEAEATSYCRLSTTIGDGASFNGRYFTRTSNEPVIFCGCLGSSTYNSYCVISTSSTAPAETHNSYGDLVPGGTITVQGVTLYIYVMSGQWAQPLTSIEYTYEGTTLHFTADAYINAPAYSGAECTVGGASSQDFMLLLEMYAEG